MLGVYDYTVILTYLSAILAGAGMIYALSGNMHMAIMMLLFCGGCDMFDGMVARTKKNRTDDEKAFGIQIDSFCDLISFGVFPAVIGYSLNPNVRLDKVLLIMFPLFGLIRLAYYNVQEMNRQQETDEKRKYFTGLPITSSALFVSILYLLYGVIPDQTFYRLYMVMLFVIGIFFISKITVPKPDKKIMIIFGVIGLAVLSRCVLRWY